MCRRRITGRFGLEGLVANAVDVEIAAAGHGDLI